MGRKNKAKIPGKSTFYKRTRKMNEGITDEAIRKLWVAKKAELDLKSANSTDPNRSKK